MSENIQKLKSLLTEGENHFLSNISIDNVIFGYEQKNLKVLLLQVTDADWMLPGGYIFKQESLEDAANRILDERIALRNVFLRQFQVFGELGRSFAPEIKGLFESLGMPWEPDFWINKRFISVGYYALVDMNKARPRPNLFSKGCSWHSVEKLPNLMLDHKKIILTALHRFQIDIKTYPLGFHLLPETFTMPELHSLFETVAGKSMDRSRFQKKMLGYGVFERLNKKTGVAHRSPYLYRHLME